VSVCATIFLISFLICFASMGEEDYDGPVFAMDANKKKKNASTVLIDAATYFFGLFV